MWMYEESLGIPLIVRLPGGPAAAVNDELAGMIDLAPTVLDLAGAEVPEDMQGRSMKPLLLGRQRSGVTLSTTTSMARPASSPTRRTG